MPAQIDMQEQEPMGGDPKSQSVPAYPVMLAKSQQEVII